MKNILKSLMIAFFISAFFCVVNIATSVWMGVMLPALPLSGGEIGGWIGFGFIQEIYYPLTTLDDPIQLSISYRFSMVAFLIGLVAVFILVVLLRHLKKPQFLYRKIQTWREEKTERSKQRYRIAIYLVFLIVCLLSLGIVMLLEKYVPFIPADLESTPTVSNPNGLTDVEGWGVIFDGISNAFHVFAYGLHTLAVYSILFLGSLAGIMTFISYKLTVKAHNTASIVLLVLSLVNQMAGVAIIFVFICKEPILPERFQMSYLCLGGVWLGAMVYGIYALIRYIRNEISSKKVGREDERNYHL